MSNNNFESRLKTLLADLLFIPVDEIDDDLSPETSNSWDSVFHMNMVMAIEAEFEIQFNESQIVEMMNYELIRETLKEKLQLKI